MAARRENIVMTAPLSWLVAILAAAWIVAVPQSASAQATRSWVSGVGNDVNPCSRTAPCKTFAGAIGKTAAGGEINCVDSGPFGSVSILKAIAIVCDDVRATVLAVNNNAISVSASASEDVLLSGLDIQGVTTSFNGVRVLQARVVRVHNSKIRGFDVAGINVAPSVPGAVSKLEVVDSIIADNAGVGILVQPAASASARVALDGVRIANSGADGLRFDAAATTGSVKGVVRNSVFAGNGASGISAKSSGAGAEAMVERCSVFDNATGLSANGAGAVIRFGGTDVSANTTGVAQANSGFVISFVTNGVVGNTANGVFGTTPLK
jgi:hypothetical protein